MIDFEFKYSEENYDFFCEIVDLMVKLFNISHDEAVERVNSQWKNHDLSEDDCMVYHEMPDFWANEIYFKSGSYWWLSEEKDNLKPKAFNSDTKIYE